MFIRHSPGTLSLPWLVVGVVLLAQPGCTPPSSAVPPPASANPALAAPGSPGSALSDAAAQGKILFTTAGPMGTGCLPCHGANGQGGGGVPANAGASADMIKAAFQGEPMKSLFGNLTDQQIQDLAAYLATLP